MLTILEEKEAGRAAQHLKEHILFNLILFDPRIKRKESAIYHGDLIKVKVVSVENIVPFLMDNGGRNFQDG